MGDKMGEIQEIISNDFGWDFASGGQYDTELEELEALGQTQLKTRLLELLKSDNQIRREIINIAMRSPNVVTMY